MLVSHNIGTPSNRIHTDIHTDYPPFLLNNMAVYPMKVPVFYERKTNI